jgi:hypothetical protein
MFASKAKTTVIAEGLRIVGKLARMAQFKLMDKLMAISIAHR